MPGNKPSVKRRLLVDHLLLAFVHYRDGEYEESAKVLQMASEMSDVEEVVDEINEEHREAVTDLDAGDDLGGGDSDPSTTTGDDVIPSEDEIPELDEDGVQAALAATSAGLRKARAARDVQKVRELSRIIFKLSQRSSAIAAAKQEAAQASRRAAATPVSRQAAALANAAKLKAKAKAK